MFENKIKDKQQALELARANRIRYDDIDESLFKDKEFYIEFLKSGSAVTDSPKHLIRFRNDKDVALAAVAENASNLQFFSAKVRKDRDVVLTACKKDGKALLYCSDSELKEDKELIKTSLNNIGYVDKQGKRLLHKYRKEVDILSDAVKAQKWLLTVVDDETFNNPEFFEKIKDTYSEEDMAAAKKERKDDKIGISAVASAAAGLAQDAYSRVDDIVMGNNTHNDIWAENVVFLAFTPVPYVHFAVKGGIAAVKGIKTLGEHAYDKYTEAKQKKLEAQLEKKDNKQL